MMRPALPGWKVECVGDDIAWMRFDSDGEGPSDRTLGSGSTLPSLLRVNFVSENLSLNDHPTPPASWHPPTLEMQSFPSDLGSSSGQGGAEQDLPRLSLSTLPGQSFLFFTSPPDRSTPGHQP